MFCVYSFVETEWSDRAITCNTLCTKSWACGKRKEFIFFNLPMESSFPGPFNQRVMVHKSSKTFSVNFMERAYMPNKTVFGKLTVLKSLNEKVTKIYSYSKFKLTLTSNKSLNKRVNETFSLTLAITRFQKLTDIAVLWLKETQELVILCTKGTNPC